MYVNKIDDLIDNIIEDFYSNVIIENKNLEKIKNETNFIKLQKDINQIILQYTDSIPSGTLNEITKTNDGQKTLIDIIKKYITIYVFLTIGFFYKGKSDVFTNNIIEFSKNQSQYNLKIENFFNSDSNSQVIQMYYMCKNIISLLEKPDMKFDNIKSEPYSTETSELLAKIDSEFITKAFKLKSLDNNVSNQAHNIIKTLIVLTIYRTNDKKMLYSLLEETELNEGEYMFIDIVEPTVDTLSFDSIEAILSKRDLFKGLAYDIWDYINEINDIKQKFVSDDDKINILLNSGIIVPILDDFLLYHQNNERYDRLFTDAKKKEETSLRYIIGKIDSTTELYSKQAKNDPKLRESIMKNFSTTMLHRKAILRNTTEEAKIINKFMNHSGGSRENIELFNDLMNYRKYTYVNFKNLDKYGFSHHFTQTVTAVRAVNFDKTTEFRQTIIDNKLQLRVGAKDSFGNIVGFMIPTNKTSIKCIKLSNIINIRDLGKGNNGYKLFRSFIKKAIIHGTQHSSSPYWLFDLEYDKIKINDIENMNDSDIVKAMIAKLYDDIVENIYFEIIDRLDNKKNGTIDDAMKILKFLEQSVLKIPLSKDIYEKLEKYIFENKIISINPDEIVTNDLLYGIEGNIVKLPSYESPKNKTIERITIDVTKVDETGNIIEEDIIEGVCQHNITWDNVNTTRKTNYTEYLKELYSFIQQYVVENTQGDYVCKSCGHFLDISRYIQDGEFDEEKGFITFSMPMEVNLEDLPEYVNYHFAIKIMDKNIEKIASSVGIPYFIGNSTTVKWRRKAIIKNTIDMITNNNSYLIKNFKERNERKTSEFGISKSLSNLFVFDMENNIFQTSSKDKDQEQFKLIKRNNIMAYILIYMMFELNESQISFFVTDKKNMCDIKIFDKVYKSLFQGLKIKKNNGNDTVDITQYKILCYLIYMISCRIAKHRLWASPQTTDKNIQKMIANIQRYVVHTVVDIINSILENSFNSKAPYIFEVFRTRFYSKLNGFFQDDKYYDIIFSQHKISFITASVRPHLRRIPENEVVSFTYKKVSWRTELPVRFYPPYLKKIEFNLHGITNLSNCDTGSFHKWKFDIETKMLVCSLCKSKINDLVYSESESKKIIEKFKVERSNLLAQKFCQVDGELHQYTYDSKTGKNLCIKCHKSDDNNYSIDELKNIDIVIDKINTIRRNRYHTTIQDYQYNDLNEKRYIETIIENNREKMKKEKDQFDYVNKFIDLLQSLIGNEIKGEYPLHLRNNLYIIDHDHNGNTLDREIIINDSDNKIFFKENHPHFKTDVIYYTNKTGSKVDIFYDLLTRKLLGYKEDSKNYVDVNKKINRQIKLIYSINNKIKLLGYSNEYIDLKINKINDVSSNRIENIKSTILEFQRIFNKIINGYVKQDKKSNDEEKQQIEEPVLLLSEKMNSLLDRYSKKINTISVVNNENKGRVFKHWKAIVRGTNVSDFSDRFIDNATTINAHEINKYDTSANELIFYMIQEFTKLIDYNTGFMKSNISNFIIEFIDRIFDKFNTDHLYSNHDIKRFICILESNGFLRETFIGNQIQDDAPQGFYEEYVDDEEKNDEDTQEQMIDDEEERDALDLDMNEDDITEQFASKYDHQAEIDLDYEEQIMNNMY